MTPKTSNQTKSDAQLSVLEKKAISSKIHGLIEHQGALIQKKLRIDLEIKKTQKKIKKLKKRAQTIVETQSSLTSPLFPEAKSHLRFLLEATPSDQEDVNLVSELQAIEQMEKWYQEIEDRLYVFDA